MMRKYIHTILKHHLETVFWEYASLMMTLGIFRWLNVVTKTRPLLSHRSNIHVVAINGIEPITAEYAISIINGARRLRSETVRKITIQLSKRKSRTRSKYEQYRPMFGTFRPILASLNASICCHQALPSPPEKVRFEYQAYAGNFKKQYHALTILQF